MFNPFQNRLARWAKPNRDFFLLWLLFGSAVQCLSFSIYALALSGGWITYQPQTAAQGWFSWSTYTSIWFVAHLLNGLTQSWLIGARVGKSDRWFYIALLSAILGTMVSMSRWLLNIPAFAIPLVTLVSDLLIGFMQAFFLRRFSVRAFVWVLVPICSTTIYNVLTTASDNFGSKLSYLGYNVTEIMVKLFSGLVMVWILQELWSNLQPQQRIAATEPQQQIETETH